MKQTSMRLGSTLTRTERKLVGGQYRNTSCTINSDCTNACAKDATKVCPNPGVLNDNCYVCAGGVCMYFGHEGGAKDVHPC
ncbi:MAG: hypothetical protein QM528_03635 [Phycisphaerales bacterium]|nr:hypothetical protein [Phycisphaerales bacterium]